MPVTTKIVRLLENAGVTRDALFAVLEAIEEADRVTPNVREQGVTPAALRMRKAREIKRKEREQLREHGEHRSNPTSLSNSSDNSEKKEIDVGNERANVTRDASPPKKRKTYPPLFETFWTAFPTDDGMSKAEAGAAWTRLNDKEQQEAIDGVPGFKAWAAKQGAEYRMLHACRYLSKKRFEGFAKRAEQTVARMAANGAQAFVERGTDQWDSCEARWRAEKGKAPPLTNNGWYFPQDWINGQEKAA